MSKYGGSPSASAHNIAKGAGEPSVSAAGAGAAAGNGVDQKKPGTHAASISADGKAVDEADAPEGRPSRCARFRKWRAEVRLPSWFIGVAYTGVVVYLAGCIFICLVMGLKFDLDESEDATTASGGTGRANRGTSGVFAGLSTSGAWVVSSALSVIQDLVFNQPLRAVIESALAEIVGSEVLADFIAI